MKTFKKRALFPAIAMVLVSVLALSGVSYAWFTMSQSATVNELSVNVTVADGMQISVDGGAWKSTINASDITTNLPSYLSNKNQLPLDGVKPVSSPCTVADGVMAMFLGEIQDDGSLKTTALEDADEGNYYAFDLFFNMSSDKKLVLDTGSYVTSTAETHKAVRVAFIDLGSATTGSAAQGLVGAAEKIVIWEPAATQHTSTAVAADSTILNTKVNYLGVDSAAANFTGGTAVTTLDINENATTGATTVAKELFDFAAGVNKVRVYIWLEGQDVDCNNDISGNTFNTMFKFTQA